MKPHYLTPEELIFYIDEPARSVCLHILKDNKKLFKIVPGSSHNHQAWKGGYLDHVQETMNLALVLYPAFASLRPVPFSLSDALLILFLHDIEKPWKYTIHSSGKISYKEELKDKKAQKEFREKKLHEYGLALTEPQHNALTYAEGENADYTNSRRVMNPLAAFCHICDVASARIWFDYPDPWLTKAKKSLSKKK
jgi:hypothetical protein